MGVLPALLALLAACDSPRPSHQRVDGNIEAEIRSIKAIDNHAHPVAVLSYGEEDHNVDALPMEALAGSTVPAPFAPGSPYFPAAWQALFGYRYNDTLPEHMKELDQAKAKMRKDKGDFYPAWVLNQANTDIMLANRVAMGRGLSNDRFKWTPFVDMFLLPLNNDALKSKDPDHRAFVQNEESLLSGYLHDRGLKNVPSNFDDYLTLVSHLLASWKGNGAVAVTFEFAYLRDLQIGDPPKESASRIFSIYAHSSEPSPEEYKIVQDFLFRYIAREAGRLKLPVHIHCGVGMDSYFRVANANPLALESLFNDPTLRKTRFVMLHGGWPFSREAAALLIKPNVYADFSALSYSTYPAQAGSAVRLYLESAPRKLLYASDASPDVGDIGWEETAWIGSTNGRLALGLALTGMMDDDEISLDRAKEIAHLVMRDNAHQLYGF